MASPGRLTRLPTADPVVIDLDLLPSPGPPEPGLTRPRGAAWRRIIVLATVVAVATLLTTDMAVADPPLTFPAAGAPIQVLGNTLYTTEAEGSRLSAYSLRTGRRRWTTEVPPFTEANLLGAASAGGAGGTVLLSSLGQALTVAVDADSGRIRWKRTGTPVWWSRAGDRIALMSQVPGVSGNRFAVAMVGAANGKGAVRFTGAGPVGPVYSAQRPADRVIGLFVRDDRAGGWLFDFAADRASRLPLPVGTAPAVDPALSPVAPVVAGPQFEELVVAGQRMLRVSFWGSRRELTGYAGDPLAPTWSVAGVGIAGLTWWCGAAICTSDGAQSFAFDPATGEVRWRASWGQLWQASASRAVGAWSVSRDGGRGIAVIDEATGRELLRRDTWRPIASTHGSRVPVLADTGDGQVVAILDTGRLSARRLIKLSYADECWSNETYVVCRSAPERYRAWRYN